MEGLIGLYIITNEYFVHKVLEITKVYCSKGIMFRNIKRLVYTNIHVVEIYRPSWVWRDILEVYTHITIINIITINITIVIVTIIIPI